MIHSYTLFCLPPIATMSKTERSCIDITPQSDSQEPRSPSFPAASRCSAFSQCSSSSASQTLRHMEDHALYCILLSESMFCFFKKGTQSYCKVCGVVRRRILNFRKALWMQQGVALILCQKRKSSARQLRLVFFGNGVRQSILTHICWSASAVSCIWRA